MANSKPNVPCPELLSPPSPFWSFPSRSPPFAPAQHHPGRPRLPAVPVAGGAPPEPRVRPRGALPHGPHPRRAGPHARQPHVRQRRKQWKQRQRPKRRQRLRGGAQPGGPQPVGRAERPAGRVGVERLGGRHRAARLHHLRRRARRRACQGRGGRGGSAGGSGAALAAAAGVAARSGGHPAASGRHRPAGAPPSADPAPRERDCECPSWQLWPVLPVPPDWWLRPGQRRPGRSAWFADKEAARPPVRCLRLPTL